MKSQAYLTKLGLRIRSVRLSLGLNKAEFARRIEPNNQTSGSAKVSLWESGKSEPRAKTLKRIAEMGNISVENLTSIPLDYQDSTDCPYCHYDKETTEEFTGPHMFPEYKGHLFGKDHQGLALDLTTLQICHRQLMLDEHQRFCRMCGSDLVKRRNHELG